MSELITDEIVEAAAKARWEQAFGQPIGEDWPSWVSLDARDRLRVSARAALDVAAPLIAAQALRDVADVVKAYTGRLESADEAVSLIEAVIRQRSARLTNTTQSVEDVRERFADSMGIPVEAITPTPGSNPHDVSIAQGERMMAELEARGLGHATTEDRKTADEWCQILGVTIIDPDGWRTDDGTMWDTPITEAEFHERAARSTIAKTEAPFTSFIATSARVIIVHGGTPRPRSR